MDEKDVERDLSASWRESSSVEVEVTLLLGEILMFSRRDSTMSKREGSFLVEGMGSSWTEGRRSVEASEESSVMESTLADSTMTGSSSGSVEHSVLSATVSNVWTVGAVDISPSFVGSEIQSGSTSSYINMNTPLAPSVKTSSSVELLQISQVI